MIPTNSKPLIAAALFALSLSPVALAQGTATPAQPAMSASAQPSDVASAEPRRIELKDVQARLADTSKKTVIVDARSAASGNMAKGAVHVPLDRVEEWAKTIPKDTFIVAYCSCPTEGTSLAFARKMGELGFTNVFALKGGIMGWEAANMPVEPFKQ